MKRTRIIFPIILATILLLVGCSDQSKPEDRLAEYAKLWNEQNFQQMYDYLSKDTKKKITEKQFMNAMKKFTKESK